MLEPQRVETEISPAEHRAFYEKCLMWPIPNRVSSLKKRYTPAQKEAMRLTFPKGCCYQWRKDPE